MENRQFRCLDKTYFSCDGKSAAMIYYVCRLHRTGKKFLYDRTVRRIETNLFVLKGSIK